MKLKAPKVRMTKAEFEEHQTKMDIAFDKIEAYRRMTPEEKFDNRVKYLMTLGIDKLNNRLELEQLGNKYGLNNDVLEIKTAIRNLKLSQLGI